jgi:hypothetical protein
MRTRAPATVIVLCLLALFAGCGGEEEGDPAESVPAAGEFTPPSGTPGVPPGAPYDVDGTEWEALGDEQRLAAAEAYAADNPERCGADPDLEAVADYVTATYGLDYPVYAPAAELLAEACAADSQSG